ncbi:MAG: hypothetical protein ACXWUG_10360 [Polyangiales bacterium]
MTMRAGNTSRRWTLGSAALIALGAFLVDFNDLANLPSVPSAEAQYGTSRRVARRTARRTSRRQVAYAGGYGGGGYATAQPEGCTVVTGAFWECGGIRYQQAMQGDQVVYVQVQE